MAFAICMEAALYWNYKATPEERAQHACQLALADKEVAEGLLLLHPAQKYMVTSAEEAEEPSAVPKRAGKRADHISNSSQASQIKR